MPTRADGPIRRRNVWFVRLGLVLAGAVALVAQSSAFAGQSEGAARTASSAPALPERTGAAAVDVPLQVTITGMGTVTSDPAGITCLGDCSGSFELGSTVGLTFAPAPGWRILGSSTTGISPGGCSTVSGLTQRCTGVLQGTATWAVTFAEFHSLHTQRSGSGQGTIGGQLTPGGSLACHNSGGCLRDVDAGTGVTLNAIADPGSRFDGWSGAGCGGIGACSFTVNSDTTVIATFTDLSTLTVTMTGSGTVTSSAPAINCPGDCTEVFDANTPVTLTATPATGFRFASWSGAGCGASETCNFTVNTNDVAVIANFVPEWTLTVTTIGSGTVTSAPAGIDCGSDCSEVYGDETEITLTPTAAPGFRFVGWTGGGCSGAADCTVELTADTTVTATFEPIPPAFQPPPVGDQPPAASDDQPGRGRPCGAITGRPSC